MKKSKKYNKDLRGQMQSSEVLASLRAAPQEQEQQPAYRRPRNTIPVWSELRLPDPQTRGEDGVDFINTWYAETPLGRALGVESRSRFRHSHYGMFASVEALMYYLRSPSRASVIRTMRGFELRRLPDLLHPSNITNFKAKVIDSLYQAIIHDPARLAVVKANPNTLPIEHFRKEATGLRVRGAESGWLIYGTNLVRVAIQNDTPLDLSALLDDNTTFIYDDTSTWYIAPTGKVLSYHEDGTYSYVDAPVVDDAGELSEETSATSLALSEEEVVETTDVATQSVETEVAQGEVSVPCAAEQNAEYDGDALPTEIPLGEPSEFAAVTHTGRRLVFSKLEENPHDRDRVENENDPH